MATGANWAGYFVLPADDYEWFDSNWEEDIVGLKVAVLAETGERRHAMVAEFNGLGGAGVPWAFSVELEAGLETRVIDLAWVSLAAAGPVLAQIQQFTDVEVVLFAADASGIVSPYSIPAPVEGDTGDNFFPAADGDRIIDGKEGTDTALFGGSRAEHIISVSPNGLMTVVKPGGGVDGLTSIERLDFDDGTLIFDLDSENASFAYRVYAAAYGRTPDEGGLRFWTDVLDGRGDGPPDVDDKEYVASFFLTANEFVDLYGANPTNEQYINALYENVLKREADAAGYEFWLGVIAGGQGKDDLLIWFTDSDENVANTAPDFDDGIWVL